MCQPRTRGSDVRTTLSPGPKRRYAIAFYKHTKALETANLQCKRKTSVTRVNVTVQTQEEFSQHTQCL